MQEISGLHVRPENPLYGYGSIVNRSGVHQAKVAKLKRSYIAYPGKGLGTEGRSEIEISKYVKKLELGKILCLI